MMHSIKRTTHTHQLRLKYRAREEEKTEDTLIQVRHFIVDPELIQSRKGAGGVEGASVLARGNLRFKGTGPSIRSHPINLPLVFYSSPPLLLLLLLSLLLLLFYTLINFFIALNNLMSRKF